MEKLVFLQENTDDYTYFCTNTIPFEYSSKDDFILHLLEKWDKVKDDEWPHIEVFEGTLDEYHIERLEFIVLTLEEWFLQNKGIYEETTG